MDHMTKQGMGVSTASLICLVQGCIKTKDVVVSRRVHSIVVENESWCSTRLGFQLTHMFASYGCTFQALYGFNNLHEQNVYTWTAAILAHVQNGQGEKALLLYSQMQMSSVKPNSHVFAAVLKACASIVALDEGKLIHAEIIKQMMQSDLFVGSALVNMYAKCNSLKDARKYFDLMSVRNVVSWNAMITGYAHHGHGWEALQFFKKMQQEGVEPSEVTYLCILNACAGIAALDHGKLIHTDIVNQGFSSDAFVGNTLVDMYAKCGSLGDAHKVFDMLPVRKVASWNAIMAGYTQHGCSCQTLQLFEKMQHKGVEPNKVSFVCILKSCTIIAAIDQGKLIHSWIVKQGLEFDLFVGSTLFDMYAKCGGLEDAHKVFDKLPLRDVVLWTAMIIGYAEHGLGKEALQLFEQMQQEGTEPDKVILMCMVKVSSNMLAPNQGKLVHAAVLRRGIESDLFVGNTLVDMYAKCGSLEDASRVFSRLPDRDLVSWNAMIAGYAECGYHDEAFQIFSEMRQEGTEPEKFTFVSVIKACSSICALHQGKQLHADTVCHGLDSNLFIANTLMGMYAKCSGLEDARKLFDRLSVQNLVSWNVMISGYAQHGHSWEVLQVFKKMRQEGYEPNEVTFLCVLRACSMIADLGQGKFIHCDIISQRLELDLAVGNTLVDMYTKCGSHNDAEVVFNKLRLRSVVSWNAIITGYVELGHGKEALRLFKEMQHEGIEPDELTYMCILRACSWIAVPDLGNVIHAKIREQGLESDATVGNSLVDMYAKCGRLDDAFKVFYEMQVRDVVSWNAMIGGYIQYGKIGEGLQLFVEMEQCDIEPDVLTFSLTLKACSKIAALDQAKVFHADVMKRGIVTDFFFANTLIDMYAKCGSLEDACKIFHKQPLRDVVSWNAIIAGSAQHGHCKMAIQYFEGMQQEGIKPDGVTFVCLLSACSHEGLVYEGLYHFRSLRELHGLSVSIHHYICMLDLLGRAGHLHVAEDFLLKMPFQPDSVMWTSLLGSCAKHGNLQLGKRAFDSLMKFDCKISCGYALMTNIYVANCKWKDALKIQEMRAHKAWKTAGKSRIETN